MVCGKCGNNLSIQMNEVTCKHVICSKHQGTILSSKLKDDVVTYEDRLSVARRTTYGLLSIGDKKTPVNPTSSVKVYTKDAMWA